MKNMEALHWRKQLVWGIIIMAGGLAFLLDRNDIVDLGHVWRYWPLVLVAFGLTNLVPPTSAKLVVDGLSHIGFAAWFYASFEHLWGLNFHNSWPLLIIMWGASLVLKPLLNNYFASDREREYGK